MKSLKLIAASCAVLLSACGGGGDGGASNPPTGSTAEGVYSGTVTGSPVANSVTMLVTENGTVYSLYGIERDNVLYVSGLVTGTGASNNGTFTANVKDYYRSNAPVSGSVTAGYTPGVSANGTTVGAVTTTFSTTAADALPYVYAAPASISEASGRWSVTSLSGQAGTVDVSTSGAVTSNFGGCISTGTATPAPGNRNYFNVAMSSGTSPCALPGVAFNGIAVVSPIANSTLKQLVFAGVSLDGRYASVSFGAR